MLWYTQVHQDASFIIGVLSFLYGWMLLARVETWQGNWWRPLRTGLGIGGGAVVTWVFRPCGGQMMQGVAVGLCVLLTAAFLGRGARARLPWGTAVAASLVTW